VGAEHRAGQKWLCYEDTECTGHVADPATLSFIDAIVLDSGGTFASRAELAAALTPDPPEVLTRRAELLALTPAADPRRERPFIGEVLDEIAADPKAPIALDHETVVRLAKALSDADVREFCLMLAVTSHAGAAERLWTALTRAVPGPPRAEPASLLAVCAYVRGDGALAGGGRRRRAGRRPEPPVRHDHPAGDGRRPAAADSARCWSAASSPPPSSSSNPGRRGFLARTGTVPRLRLARLVGAGGHQPLEGNSP
jgi:hypothetical protein